MNSLAQSSSESAGAGSAVIEPTTIEELEALIREAAEAGGGYVIDHTDAERLGLVPPPPSWEVVAGVAAAEAGATASEEEPTPSDLQKLAERYSMEASGPYLHSDPDEDLYYLVMAPRAA